MAELCGRPCDIRGKIMETREASPIWTTEVAIPGIFSGRRWLGAVAGAPVVDERQLEQRALLRWADDAGRWVGESNSTPYEVRI
jgi:hypothetical protein